MRLRETLLKAATLLVASGCGGNTLASSFADAASVSSQDGGDDADAAMPPCSGCGCPGPVSPTVSVDAAVACAIAQEPMGITGFQGNACSAACNQQGDMCNLPQSYVDAFNALHGGKFGGPDGGPTPAEAGAVDGGSDAAANDGGPTTTTDAGDAGSDAASLPGDCPQVSGPITVTCTVYCVGGRRTEGFARRGPRASSDGARLAHMAWLEAVSVHAFERLERELAAHGAPPALRRDARRARRDEVRHTAMTTRLARRRGATPAVPEKPTATQVRPLVDVAIENAVEGCVRETHGALLAFVEALSSPDPSLRRAMRSIAEDECRHAELAWSVHAWALVRLRPSDRRRVEDALREAARGVPFIHGPNDAMIASQPSPTLCDHCAR